MKGGDLKEKFGWFLVPSHSRLVARGVFFLWLAAFLVWCFHLRAFLIDDAFITYRFGLRLAEDFSLRWNLMQDPVEGYTSFLAVWISAFFIGLGVFPLAGWKILNICLFLFGAFWAGWTVHRIARFFCPRANQMGLPWVGAWLWCANPTAAVHAMSGMETILFACWLSFCGALVAGALFPKRPPFRPRRKVFYMMGLAFLVLGWIRPEGALWAFLVALCLGVYLRRQERKQMMRGLLWGFLAPGLVYFLWRYNYFGTFLPNTFYAKTLILGEASGWDRWLPSRYVVGQFLWFAVLPPLLLAFSGSVILGVRHFWGWRKAEEPALPSPLWRTYIGAWGPVVASLCCIVFFARAHLLMGYGYRFFFPFGLLVLPWCLALGLCLAGLGWTSHRYRRRLVKGAVMAVLLVFALGRPVMFYWEAAFDGNRRSAPAFKLVENNRVRPGGYRKVGEVLNAIAPRLDKHPLLFHHNMGQMMYYASEWNTVDPVGLLDEHIARNGFSEDYLFSQRPDLLLLPSRQKDRITEYNAEHFPDISANTVRDVRIRRYSYLGYYPDRPFYKDGAMHFYVRSSLFRVHPWLRVYLRDKLGLRKSPDFQLPERLR